jgi:hypothetical protein
MLIRLMVLALRGWAKPLVGSQEVGVVESSIAKDGFDVMSHPGSRSSIKSEYLYEGYDKDRDRAMFEFHVSAEPSSGSLFFITQVPLKNLSQGCAECGLTGKSKAVWVWLKP